MAVVGEGSSPPSGRFDKYMHVSTSAWTRFRLARSSKIKLVKFATESSLFCDGHTLSVQVRSAKEFPEIT